MNENVLPLRRWLAFYGFRVSEVARRMSVHPVVLGRWLNGVESTPTGRKAQLSAILADLTGEQWTEAELFDLDREPAS